MTRKQQVEYLVMTTEVLDIASNSGMTRREFKKLGECIEKMFDLAVLDGKEKQYDNY